ncbi:MAG: beta-N-acetylhexosaminidase [Capnocytophaga sp.]|nr:beta-N-acetylhexosaminidase [Capnocytophaga sp.]
MKKNTVFLFFLIFSNAIAQHNLSALLPYPNQIEPQKGILKITKKEKIHADGGLEFASSELKTIFQKHFGFEPISSEKGNIRLKINPQLENEEQYVLDIRPQGISIEGKTAAGVLYGIYTLEQILIGDTAQTALQRIQSVRINDRPAYPFRALMLDPARHFLPLDGVKKYIAQMAKFKYNTLQIHLTDDQGWRIEIKSRPQLTEKGNTPTKNGERNFYTQEELTELIDFSVLRNVEIIPEIDVPGHTAALLAAYPDLRCDFLKDSVFVIGKTDNVMLSAANPEVYALLDDVIREVSAIFPSKKIHLGGDESAIGRNWAKSDENLKLMSEKGYTKPEELMNIFFGSVLASVKKYGMHAILWCELDNIRMPANRYLFDYPKDVTLVTWRYGLTPKCIELTGLSGNNLILAPGEYAYLDYPQYKNDLPEYNNWGMPTTTLEKTYSFDPTYGLSTKETAHIQGVMGTLWGEAIKDINRANYMTYPRGLALAEAGWTEKQFRNWDSFRQRIYPNLTELMKNGTSFRVPFEIAEIKQNQP